MTTFQHIIFHSKRFIIKMKVNKINCGHKSNVLPVLRVLLICSFAETPVHVESLSLRMQPKCLKR